MTPGVSRLNTQRLLKNLIQLYEMPGQVRQRILATLVVKLTSDQNTQPDFTSANRQHNQPQQQNLHCVFMAGFGNKIVVTDFMFLAIHLHNTLPKVSCGHLLTPTT
jgi:hypothetical protein